MTDFCYSRPMLKRILHHAELMDRMMERLDIDAAAAVRVDRGMAFYEARARCIGCCRERQCRDWLTHSEVGSASDPPKFCCNAAFFRALRIATIASSAY